MNVIAQIKLRTTCVQTSLHNENLLNISMFLKEGRVKYHLTQEQLANKVGKQRSYIARIESHGGNNINLQTLKEIIERGFDGKVKIKFEILNFPLLRSYRL